MKSNPRTIEEWLSQATAGLEPAIRDRLRLELSSHYDDAFDAGVSSGLSRERAAAGALAALGEVQAVGATFRGEYALQMPWDGTQSLPRKLPQFPYGYIRGNQLIGCSQEELIERCRSKETKDLNITLAWTPESEQVLPVQRIPFLFQAIKDRRTHLAQWQLFCSLLWASMVLLEYRKGNLGGDLRHLLVFLAMLSIVPAFQAVKTLFYLRSLTPEKLAKEADLGSATFEMWCSLQKAPLVMGLAFCLWGVTVTQMFFSDSIGVAGLAQPAVFAGEWWRLFTGPFLHAGLWHILFNTIALITFGRIIETAVRRMYLPLVFASSLLAGSLASLHFSTAPSVGASGGIMGIIGFLFAAGGRAESFGRIRLREQVIGCIVFIALLGIMAFDLFDNAAHLGGLLAGLALGYWLPIERRTTCIDRWVRIAGSISLVVIIAGAATAVFLLLE